MTHPFTALNASVYVFVASHIQLALASHMAKPPNSGVGKCINSSIWRHCKSHDNGKSVPFIGRAADNWNNSIIYHNGKLYLILRGLMAWMLIQKQHLDWLHLYFGVCFEEVMLQKFAYIWKTGSSFYTGLINLLWVGEPYPQFGNFPLIVS